MIKFATLLGNLEFLRILICSVVKFRFVTKSLSYKKKFFVIIIKVLLLIHIKLNFKLKNTKKYIILKTLKKL